MKTQMLSLLTLLVPLFAACTEQLPDTDTDANGSAASYVPFEGTTTDPALLYNRRFAIEDIKQFETLPERLPEDFFDVHRQDFKRYWPAVTDKAYKQAIFEAVKEVIAFVDHLPKSPYDFKRTWGDFNDFSTRFDNWEEWLDDIYRDYEATSWMGNETFTTCFDFALTGLSLEGKLPAAYRSLLFNEAVAFYYIGSDYEQYGRSYREFGNLGYRIIPPHTDPIENHELYVSALLCRFQRLYNAFREASDEEIMNAIDDCFNPSGRYNWFYAFAIDNFDIYFYE
jgi:hypothetical protein